MSIRALVLAVTSLPWFLHAVVVLSSSTGARPLASQALASLLLAVGCLFSISMAAWTAHGTSSPPQPTSALPRAIRWPLASLTGAAVAAFALSVLAALLLPIVAYDALAYRIPVIAEWLDLGRVAWVATDDPVRNGYPLGQEAVSALVAAATGSLRFADATSFFYVASGALSIVWLAESLGVRPLFARAAAAVFVLAPMMLLNAGSGYVDAAFAGATVALFCSAALATRAAGPDPATVAAAGLAAANVLALKGTGLGFVALCALAALLRLAVRNLRQRWRASSGGAAPAPVPARSSGGAALALALALALPGAFWVARDVAHTGNPLWPVEVQISGRTIWPGVGTMEEIIDVRHNTPADFAALSAPGRVLRTWLQVRGPARVYDDRRAGLGWAWPLLALPAIAACLIRAVRDARQRARGGLGSLVFVLALSAGCFALQPMNWWSRYTLWLWGAGALALAFEAERLWARGRLRTLACGAAVLTALCVGEGALALSNADGAKVALSRLLQRAAPVRALSDARAGLNAVYWVPPDFWTLGLESQGEVCRGSWKPDTDDAILDGVFAQLTPRPRVHILDDGADWPRLRRAYLAQGCAQLLLLKGSPALPKALRDPSVSVERVLGFDPLFLVRRSELAAAPPI